MIMSMKPMDTQISGGRRSEGRKKKNNEAAGEQF